MRKASVVGVVGMVVMAGCASTRGASPPAASATSSAGASAPIAAAPGTEDGASQQASTATPSSATTGRPLAVVDGSSDAPAGAPGAWVGASADSDVMLARGGDAYVGVWVDVPESARARVRAPVDLALVIDTSGSMEGAKIEAARQSARTMVERLHDGDVVSIDTFSDQARPLVAPVELTPRTRAHVLSAIAELATGGSTNLFDGLSLGEAHVAQADAHHPVRRIVLISDGEANVGPSSPQALGELASRSLMLGAQVTSLGVGLDYDERTLDAIAERTSGRLFHVGDPREMKETLEHEIDLLASTVADRASLEVVPAPGVQVTGVDGASMEWASGGAVRIPLGTLFAGQHREALVRVRVNPSDAGTQRALASVRLVFRDPSEDDVERVQEVLARVSTTDDPAVAAAHPNARTHAMMATLDAAQTELQAAQALGSGNYAQAQSQLAATERSLRTQAAHTTDVVAKKRLEVAAQSVAAAHHRAAAAPSAAPAAVREDVLQMNSAGMKGMGY